MAYLFINFNREGNDIWAIVKDPKTGNIKEYEFTFQYLPYVNPINTNTGRVNKESHFRSIFQLKLESIKERIPCNPQK